MQMLVRELGINPNAYTQMKFRNSAPYKEIINFLSKRKISINPFFYTRQERSLDKAEKDIRLLSRLT